MLHQPRRFLLSCFQTKGVHRASSSASEWWLEPARASICPCQRIQANGGARGRCNREGTMLHQLVNMSLGCSCGSQEQSGGRGCGREGGGSAGRKREMEEMKGSMPVPHSSLSWGELYQTKARPINQAIISCKEKALTSSSNWLIHLTAQDRLALLWRNYKLAQRVGMEWREETALAMAVQSQVKSSPFEEGLTGGRQGQFLGQESIMGLEPGCSSECAGFARN